MMLNEELFAQTFGYMLDALVSCCKGDLFESEIGP